MIIMSGNVTLQKNQARVFTFMGDYKGTLKGHIYAAVPFWWTSQGEHNLSTQTIEIAPITVNDKSGNPIIIACNIFAHIEDTYAATFSITDLPAYLKLKGEVALRSIAKNYPMDSHDEAVISLRGSSAEIAEELAKEITISYQAAGYVLETNPVGITSLTYAPEIAQVMLQRQQAKATVEARETITEGAVQIVKNTLDMLEKEKVVVFDQASKQQLVTGLMITLVSQHGASPVLTVK
jgi:regulator of protease activity HflC (stomatin/prohibitin superfamily)